VGEALVLLDARTAGGTDPLAGAAMGGAEANVAAGLARWGVAATWAGRLGDDAPGRFLRDQLARAGVRVVAEVDPARRTGTYTKVVTAQPGGEPRTESRYDRTGSAASAMDPAFLARPEVAAAFGEADLVHTSGITAALSPTCRDLMRTLLRRPRRAGQRVVFDVNWREQLWPDGDPAVVVELAGLADVVLVGADEAERVFGTAEPGELRRLLPSPETLLVKDGARRALAVDRSGEIHDVPALAVTVVEVVGAGDAFAAGYLAGVAAGDSAERCLRRGHVSAATVLTVRGDTARLPDEPVLEGLLGCSDEQWRAVRASAAGFTVPPPRAGGETPP
jgi:2-dehydro-3-deoxygluconokinase